MTIRHLRIFIAVAQTGQMGAAARALYISQPTVSKVIAEIEEDYGVRLFERLSKKLYITESGKQLLGYARHIIALFDEMERDLHVASVHLSLKVGATNTVGRCFLPGVVGGFERKNPNIFTQVVVDNTRVIEEMILTSQLDLAVVEGEVSSGDLLVRPVARDALVLICPKGHPLAEKKEVALSDLEGEPFVLREQGSGTREHFEQRLLDMGITIVPKWVCRSSDSILAAVEQGQGLSVISRLVVEQAEHQGGICVCPLADEGFDRVFQLIYHKNKFVSDAIGKFIDELEQSGEETWESAGNGLACGQPSGEDTI